MKEQVRAPRLLIVNADDANLTPGVSQAILEAHATGIVTSTTLLVNLPLEATTVRAFKAAKSLGVGIHLNVTLGAPVSSPQKLNSLISGDGMFRKRDSQVHHPPEKKEVALEYKNQILLFKKHFGRLPTHMDTHHQVHDHPLYWDALIKTAKYFRLPVRRSLLSGKMKRAMPACAARVLGDLNPEGYWRKNALLSVLRSLAPGISEVMCHPGIVDSDLRKITSFTTGRAHEFRLFRSPFLRRWIAAQGIRLTHYGMCYNW